MPSGRRRGVLTTELNGRDEFARLLPTGRLRTATFNASGLLGATHDLAIHKHRHLTKLARMVDVLYIQEARGGSEDVLARLPEVAKCFDVFDNPGTGAILTLLRKSVFPHIHCDDARLQYWDPQNPRAIEVQHSRLVPGRVSITSLFFPQPEDPDMFPIQHHYLNIHNHGLSSADVKAVYDWVYPLHQRAVAYPGFVFLHVGGDLNYCPPNENMHVLANPKIHVAKPQFGNAVRIPAWNKLLGLMLELQASGKTHFNAQSGTETRLDRVFLGGASYMWEFSGSPRSRMRRLRRYPPRTSATILR